MEKIVIIGSPGAGKSTLAKKIAFTLKMRVFHLDRFFWYRGWRGKTRDTRIFILECMVMEKQWIIEGNYLRSSESRLNAADTIIFLDMPPLLCLWRVIKRHWVYLGRSRRDIPEGCIDKLTLFRILKVLAFPLRERRKLEKKLRNFPSKKIVRLQSAKEVENFLAQLQLPANGKTQSSAAKEERHLITSGIGG
ncbi:MAG: hypothetical protein M3Y81_01075 [Chloroflexota bacterium]|nr:hypothetical protein [Chloroflexota bacterium]